MNSVNQIKKVNQLKVLLLQLQVSELAEVMAVTSDVLVFLARYSFLFENTPEPVPSCEVEEADLLVSQALGERPMRFTDPSGLRPLTQEE